VQGPANSYVAIRPPLRGCLRDTRPAVQTFSIPSPDRGHSPVLLSIKSFRCSYSLALPFALHRPSFRDRPPFSGRSWSLTVRVGFIGVLATVPLGSGRMSRKLPRNCFAVATEGKVWCRVSSTVQGLSLVATAPQQEGSSGRIRSSRYHLP
jgi:hypothetical protein